MKHLLNKIKFLLYYGISLDGEDYKYATRLQDKKLEDWFTFLLPDSNIKVEISKNKNSDYVVYNFLDIYNKSEYKSFYQGIEDALYWFKHYSGVQSVSLDGVFLNISLSGEQIRSINSRSFELRYIPPIWSFIYWKKKLTNLT